MSQEFSTAGFFSIPSSGRTVQSMNPGWKFLKGSQDENAAQIEFDDSSWSTVSLPNGMEYLPSEASGGMNYRGQSWYRKQFHLGQQEQGRRLVLHFEAIMGKSTIWVNGQQVAEHFGGFLPIGIDITKFVRLGTENLIAVRADNSDDPLYPPGKPQAVLDFCYFGGIYRDCWLVTTGQTYISDPNMAGIEADGGLFISYDKVSEHQAQVNLRLNLNNEIEKSVKGTIQFNIINSTGELSNSLTLPYSINKNTNKSFTGSITVKNPALWSPESPNLYKLEILVKDANGNTIDGYAQKMGIRSISFNPQDGLVLNGKPYGRKLIGANRHQDFAVIGNALSNSLHWRDAKKLKEAGMEIIRNAHYPQDPAFMDACAEMGLFVIVNTPGWQFWNADPVFEQRVYSDIQNMVRRDRNSPSVILWEPILNETRYPEEFARNVHQIVHKEYPYPGCYTASDDQARGKEHFDVLFAHPQNGNAWDSGDRDSTKVYFTREWGDNVEDWNSHNSPSRVARQWGEVPQLIQAQHYENPPYTYSSYRALLLSPNSHFGGTLWHSFDHQRGYHPDPFYGGIMDAFRRPKYSYYMFQAQAAREPMVFIANELNPFSPNDVTVYSSCQEVRLRTFTGDSVRILKREPHSGKFLFFNAFNFMDDKTLSRDGRQKEAYIIAEGLNNGVVVATTRRTMARRASKVVLSVDDMGVQTEANGSDLVVVTASMEDRYGNIKRLNNALIRFEIQGEGCLISADVPQPILWGEAPVLVQSTTKPGEIKIKASVWIEGDNTPLSSELVLETRAPKIPLLFDRTMPCEQNIVNDPTLKKAVDRTKIEQGLREVEQQQAEFGEKQN